MTVVDIEDDQIIQTTLLMSTVCRKCATVCYNVQGILQLIDSNVVTAIVTSLVEPW